tara:strand:- start:219 stop:1913 length:1695 start_codon:yes stop_codon:yes gene_type:complete
MTRQYVRPNGVASGEAIGIPGISAIRLVFVNGIASAEAFGTPGASLTIYPAGVVPGEGVGLPAVDLTVFPASVASLEAFGSPSVDMTVYPDGIVSAEAFGNPTVSWDQVSAVDGIGTSEAFGTPSIDPIYCLEDLHNLIRDRWNTHAQTATASYAISPVLGNTDAGLTVGLWEYQLWAGAGSVALTDGDCSNSTSCNLDGTFSIGIVTRPEGTSLAYKQANVWDGLGYDITPICQLWHGNTDCSAGGATWTSNDTLDPPPTDGHSNTSFGLDISSACSVDGTEHVTTVTVTSDDGGTSISATITLDCASSILTIYDNVTEEPPDNAIWARFEVDTEYAEQTATGHEIKARKYGRARASLHAPLDQGDGEILARADLVRALFRDVTLDSTVVFRQPSVRQQGVRGRWWVVDVDAPFYVDATEVRPSYGTAALTGALGALHTHNVIRAHFQSQVADVEGVPVHYDNSTGEPPATGLWIRLSILDGTSTRASSGVYRTSGVVDAAVFAPLGDGDQNALAIADRIVRAFLPATVSGVTFRLPYATSVGRAGAWWQTNITCPFFVDETI